MNHFRHFLLGQKFLLRTDHGSLRWIFEFKDPREQVARWLEILAQYDLIYSIGLEINTAMLIAFQEEIMRKAVVPMLLPMLTNVQNVVDLGVPVENLAIKDDPLKQHKLRALTRGQAKKIVQAGQQPKNLTSKIRGNNSRNCFCQVILQMTSKCYNIQMLQREDQDLGILHSWLDKNFLPSRDEIAQYSPAVRKYWLNTENTVRKRGVLYQKRWVYTPVEAKTLQLLVPKALRQEIVRNNHDTLLSGHFGVNKTSSKIKKKYHWYQFDSAIKTRIQERNLKPD